DATVDSLSRHLLTMGPAAAELAPSDAPELCSVFPVLAVVPALASAAAARPPALDQTRGRALSALRELLGRLARMGPLLPALDDLHWGAADSRQFLGRLIAPPDPPPILFIGAFRSRRERAVPLVSTLVIQPLDVAGATALARQLLEGQPD